MQSKIGKLVALREGSDQQERQPHAYKTLPDHENIGLGHESSVISQHKFVVRETCLVEPTGGQNSARREHNAKRQHINRRLIGEQEIGFDAAWIINVNKRPFVVLLTHPSMVETAFRNMA